MNLFESALKAVAPHFRVRGHTSFISQEHPLTYGEIDLQRVAVHKQPGGMKIRIRLFRGRWTDYSLIDFRPREVRQLCAVLEHWEKLNHSRRSAKIISQK